MAKVVNDELSPYLNVDAPKELQPLLKIPSMTRKVAQVLVDRGICTAEAFVENEPQAIANYLKLSVGFEIQVSHLNIWAFGKLVCFYCDDK